MSAATVELLPQEEYFITEGQSFCAQVEEIVFLHKMSYIDAVLFLAEKKGLDESGVAALINPVIKNFIHKEAVLLHLRKPAAELPF